MDKDPPLFQVGDWVWFNAQAVTVHSVTTTHLVVTQRNCTKEHSVAISDVQRASARLMEGTTVHDLLSTTTMGEFDLIYNLRRRLAEGSVFTYLGSSVLYLKPSARGAPVGLFSDEIQSEYNAGAEHRGPHMYEAVNQAYLRCLRGATTQAVVFSGAPGSGKSLLARKAVDFVVHRCPKGRPDSKPNNPISLSDQLDAAEAIITALSSAAMPWGACSTRSALSWKFFFHPGGAILGVHLLPRILEEGRLVWRGAGEGCFRLLHLMVAGADEEMREKHFILHDADSYDILRGAPLVDGTEAADELERISLSMALLGIPRATQNEVWRVLSGILLLGNVRFVIPHNEAVVDNEEILTAAASQLGVDVRVRSGRWDDNLEQGRAH